jgi:hypothetical protein
VAAGVVAVAGPARLGRVHGLLRTEGVPRATQALAALLVLAVIGSIARTDAVTRVGDAFPAASLRRAVAHARCVTTDSVGVLALLDVLGRDLRHRCPLLIDPGGLTHDRDAAPPLADGLQAPRRTDLRWQREVNTYLRSGQVEVLVRRHVDGFDSSINRRLRRSPVLAGTGTDRVYGNHPTSGQRAGRGSVTSVSHKRPQTPRPHHRQGAA